MRYLFTSKRLGFRNWLPQDVQPFSLLCSDSEVMKYFPKKLTLKETENLIERYWDMYKQQSHTYYATEVLATKEFIGFIGLAFQTYKSPFTPATDIGWRLHHKAWGKGFATEGAKKCLSVAFGQLGKKQVISCCPRANKKSENVMQKIGMTLIGEFIHPAMDLDSHLQPMLCYQIKKEDFFETKE